jgi:hypothetical protein
MTGIKPNREHFDQGSEIYDGFWMGTLVLDWLKADQFPLKSVRWGCSGALSRELPRRRSKLQQNDQSFSDESVPMPREARLVSLQWSENRVTLESHSILRGRKSKFESPLPKAG